MNRFICILWCFAFVSFTTLAKPPSYGEAIPERAWEVVDNPELGIRDAAYLDYYVKFTDINVTHYRLIRILSEHGKAAAEFVAPKEYLRNVRGRVIDRNGSITEFDRKEDFVDIMTYRTRSEKVKTKILIPPGLTDDCIVEIEWTISGKGGLEGDNYVNRHLIPEPFYCVKKVLDLPNFQRMQLQAGQDDWLVTRSLWSNVNPPIKFTKTKYRGSEKTLVYENVPPRKAYPYSNNYFDTQIPYFLIFRTIPNMGKDTDTFWKSFVRDYIKPDYNAFSMGGEYRKFLKDLKGRLGADPKLDPAQNPLGAARFALDALHRRLSVTYLLKADQLAAFRMQKERKAPKLEDCFRDGWANPSEMTRIYVKTLRDLGIQHQLLLTTNHNDPPFRAGENNPFAISWRPLVLVVNGEQQAMFCPWTPQFASGHLPSYYQGLPALVIDPDNKWAISYGATLHYGAAINQCQTNYQATLGKDGTFSVAMEQSGSGAFNAEMTESIYSLTDQERDAMLAERWQRRFGDDYLVEKVTTQGDRDIKDICVVSVEASMDLSGDSQWLSVNPFPGSMIDMYSPPMWPSDRTQPIFLNRPFYQVDTMRLQVPQGWKLKGEPSWQKANSVGTVKFVALQEGQTITIQRAITLNNHMLEAKAEPSLRVFLAWIEEVEAQQIAVSQGGA
ncbi:DUF3858 domain-containing protein [Acanthopleuribacter pedis]|uniref:DUF3858 domain-containing protein n=1 Tax=Acanthopleuribacter pedis TaxID=442870 RepID=A0A8J7U243_9BACT|nr:DUF3858 domain-containing protein [Acanthopleuribacter pedis]MBO1318873.1 DUF3858 domain-containing protein [Acanthopleuribacter pedis]